jgi:hypothetical protein
VGGHRDAGSIQDRGRDIEVVLQPGVHRGRLTRPAQDGRDVARRLVGGLVIGVDAELAERLAVVGADQDRGVVEHAEIGELVQQSAERVVGVAHPDVVAVEDPLDVVHARRVPRLARRRVAPLVGPEAPGLLRGVRARQLPVARAHRFGVPGGHRIVGEGVPVLGRRVVGRVRVPQVHVQEPVVAAAAAVEPVERAGQHRIGALDPHAAHQVQCFLEAGVPPRRRVAERKARQRRRVIAVPVEEPRPRRGRVATHEPALGPPRSQVGGDTAVVDDPVADPERAGDQRGAARQAGHVGRVDVVESDAVASERVDVRGRRAVVAVATDVIGAQRVDVEIQDAHGFSPGPTGRTRRRSTDDRDRRS